MSCSNQLNTLDCKVYLEENKCPGSCPYLVRERKEKKQIIERKDKRGRIFHRLISGLQIAQNQVKLMRFITLTSGKDIPRPIKESFDILRKRIERAEFIKDGFDGFKFNRYFCLRTKEGPNGVLHIIYWGGGYIPQKWLSWNWEQIHWAYKADIRACWTKRRKVNGLVGYLLPYLTERQPVERMSYGWKWAWLGFCKSWKHVKQSVSLMRAQGSMKTVPRWVTLTKIRSTETYEIPLIQGKDRYRNGSKEYWFSLSHNPPPTTRKTAFCNPSHDVYNKKYFDLDTE